MSCSVPVSEGCVVRTAETVGLWVVVHIPDDRGPDGPRAVWVEDAAVLSPGRHRRHKPPRWLAVDYLSIVREVWE